VLGSGPEADHHGRLRDTVRHELEAKQPDMANAETEAGKQPNGSARLWLIKTTSYRQ
jgi:hypothetical protein